MKRIYMDHAATTGVRPEVLEAMLPALREQFGNPSSIHAYGREAKKMVERAREQTAKAINARPEEIYFTSGGSEADNWAIRNAVLMYAKRGKHIITSSIEHHAVLHTCEALEKEGYAVTYLPVDSYGIVSPESVENAIRPDTVLVTIMMANNEIGTIEPIEEIGRICRERGVLFHTDAVQAVGSVAVDVKRLNADMLSLSAHKFYGPKGIGALYVKKGMRLSPLIFGGAQERGKRAGTENVPGIVALGAAIELAVAQMPELSARLSALRDRLILQIHKRIDHVRLNGHPERRLPGNVSFCFQYIEGEALLLSLDLKGIAGSSGSACTSGSLDPSHVLLAIGLPHEIAHGSLRLSLGAENTDEDVDYVLNALCEIVARLRDMSPLYMEEREKNYV